MSKAPAVISPHLDQGTVDLANLQALQRIEAGVESILLRAGQVAVYSLDLELHEWTRKDVEGSCFVVKCATAPRFRVVVINRLSHNNYVEAVSHDFVFELQSPYVLFKNEEGEVTGIWFYEEKEASAMDALLTKIVKNLQQQHELQLPQQSQPQQPTPPPQAPGSNGHASEDVARFFATLGVGSAGIAPAAPSGAVDPIAMLAQGKAPTVPRQSVTHEAEAAKAADSSAGGRQLLMPSELMSVKASQPAPQTRPPIPATAAPEVPRQPPMGRNPESKSIATTPPSAPVVVHSAQPAEVSKEAVREAMLRLAMSEKFIDMMHKEINKAAVATREE
mmetsp:Transcript_9602/g.35188  ORF Transcript_9602/g.35188 Transcript_9602/m.35188 type:complete len:334 (-) Transcript_9602:147-1148(-)